MQKSGFLITRRGSYNVPQDELESGGVAKKMSPNLQIPKLIYVVVHTGLSITLGGKGPGAKVIKLFHAQLNRA